VRASARSISFILLGFLAMASVSGCGRNAITNQPASLVSSSSIWLRNTYDTDPSIYVGRFIAPGVTDLDESNTMVLACSKHITAKFIDGGGVDYTEDMHVSTQLALRLGMPVVASGSAGFEANRTAKAQYKLTGKLVAEIADPDAFAACCKAQPDQCTDRFIGEFIQGTGTLQHSAERNFDVEGQGTNPSNGLSGEGGVSRSAEWQRAAEFPNPVYFAFKINPTPYTQGAVNTCPSWVDNPPVAEGGIYVVGSTDNQRNESGARDAALRAAGTMASKSVGIDSVPVVAESWCVTTKKKRERGPVKYSARVLAFVSNEAIAQAREQDRIRREQQAAQLAAMQEAAREQARLDAEREAAERDAPNDAPPPDDTTDTPTETHTQPTETPPPAGGRDIEQILAAVRAEGMSEDKLSALRFSVRGTTLTASEARLVLDEFGMSEDKLEALELMRTQIEDPNNWQVLVDAFASSFDREAARELAPGG
jgi:hypothetical protein